MHDDRSIDRVVGSVEDLAQQFKESLDKNAELEERITELENERDQLKSELDDVKNQLESARGE